MTEESLFLAALDKPSPADRQAFLVEACGGDAALLARVQKLLGADAGDCGILDRSVPDKVATALRSTPAPSRVVGRYKLLEEIGAGGMGSVWMAEQTEPVRRKVALKLIKPGMDSKQVIARFEAERQALALMDHPNIAKVLDGGLTEEGRPYFVMEYVKGVPITEYCDAARLSVPERLELFVQVCAAVQHAHQKGIIHRDLKPSNVLVAPYDERPVPKVIDFGLAKAIHGGLTERTLHTAHGTVLGTPLYMSPEQAQLNNLDVDTRSDVYAMGVLLYELLTGTTPLDKQRFQEAAWGEILRVIREEEPPRPSTRLSSTEVLPALAACRKTEASGLTKLVRGELDWIVMRALEKDRNRRYDSAANFAQDVQRFLTGEPVQAVPPSAGYRLRKFARKHRAGLAVALTFLVLLVAGVAVSTWQAVRATNAQKKADQNADQARTNERLAYDRAYNSDLRLVQQAWEKNQFDYLRELLERQRPERTDGDERRGFEWDYWNHQLGLRVLTFDRPKALVGCVAFSPDGSTVASGGGDILNQNWFIDVWDAKTAQPIRSLSGTGLKISGITFSPDGKRLVAMSPESVARVCDVRTGKVVFTLEGHKAGSFLHAVAYSRDGKLILTAANDATIRLWDADTGKARQVLKTPNQATCLGFSGDGARLAGGKGEGDRAVCVWEVATGKSLFTLRGHTGPIATVAFSPDGKWIASGGIGQALLWDAAGSGKPQDLKVSANWVTSMAFSPDSKRLALAGARDGVKVWDVETGQFVFAFKGQPGEVSAVAFSPDGTRLASGDVKGTVAVWDAAAAVRAAIPLRGVGVPALAVGAEGKFLYGTTAYDGLVRVWEAATGRELRRFDARSGHRLAVHPAGRQVVTQSAGVLEVWDVQEGKRLRRLPTSAPQATAAYSPDGEHLATISDDGVHIRSAATLESIRAFSGDAAGLALAYTRRGDYLAVRDGRGVLVWEVATGRLAAQLADPTKEVGPLAFSPDGESLATGNNVGIILVWQWRTDRPARQLRGHTDMVRAVAYSPDGRRLASTSQDGSVKVWDPAAGEELLNFTMNNPGLFHCVAFSPCGKHLYAGADGGVRAWEGATR